MEEFKALTGGRYVDVVGVQKRSVLRKCTHTAEEHIAMCTPSPTCPDCEGAGMTWNGKYFEDCTCRTFCCKWLTETQISVPWCIAHDRVAALDPTEFGVVATRCGAPLRNPDDACSISLSVVWRTVTVSGEKDN